MIADWKDTCVASGCNYLNTAGFVRVPVSAVTTATLRPGTYMPGMVRGPGEFDMHTTLAKSFSLGAEHEAAGSSRSLQPVELEELQQSQYKHEQRGLRPDHRRRARAGVSVRSKAYVLTHYWKIGKLEDW